MPNAYSTKGLTGKSARKMVNVKTQALVAPIVDQIPDLAKKTHKINDATTSGKQRGAMVICRKTGGYLGLCVATGKKETDPWLTLANASILEVVPA